ncbi:MAG: TIGR03915 family putative DNA repair protein [Bacillota bacterium]
MINYYYDGSFEGLLTSVYEAYYSGEPPNSIVPHKNMQENIFQKNVHIKTDSEKASKVYKAIYQKISYSALKNVYHAYLSELECIDYSIYQYLKLGFKMGKSVDLLLSDERVLSIHSASRKVRGESHRMLGLLRFRKLSGEIYYAPYSPDYNITAMIFPHFVKRLSDQMWVIHDTRRNYAAAYDKNECVLIDLPSEFQYHVNKGDDHYELLWKKYFKSICIKGRINPRLQKQHMPTRYWKYLVEK